MKAVLRKIELGWEEQGRGTPLLLLHAFPFDRRMWRAVVPELVRGARVITVDFRGLGESRGTGSIDDAADDLAALLDHLGIARAVVGGLSLGGYQALAFAARHPLRLAGLLLADTRAAADTPEARSGRDAAIVRVAREGAGDYVSELVPRLLSGLSPAALGYALALAHSQSAMGVASALAAMRDRPDRSALLPTLAVPSLVVVGGADRITPSEEARAMADRIPGASFVEIAGAGHLSSLEAPEAFATAVLSLLTRAGEV